MPFLDNFVFPTGEKTSDTVITHGATPLENLFVREQHRSPSSGAS
jgi:hypothetical protein